MSLSGCEPTSGRLPRPDRPIERTRVVRNAPRWNAVDGTSFRPDGVEVSLAPLLELAEDALPDVAAHMERTARLARLFALELGLSRSLLDQVVRTARVHDIGKLAMRDSADPHFIAGQKILARKPVLMTLATLVRGMNERWDGTGRPDGLKGSSIPLPTRIVAVCEAFDTLTNPFEGEDPTSIEDAAEELRDRSGSDFDPGVVEPFCDFVTELEPAATNC
jgi:response regulator RpfG family c-di-GMP phosphodiesterase